MTFVVANIAEREGRKHERMRQLESQVVAEIPPKQPTRKEPARKESHEPPATILEELLWQLRETKRKEASRRSVELEKQARKVGYEYSASATVQPFVLRASKTYALSTSLTQGGQYVALGILLVIGALALAMTGALSFWLTLFDQLLNGF